MDIFTIRKYQSEFEKKAQKYEDAYQMDGSRSARRTADKYIDLEDICTLALKEQEEADSDKRRREKNGDTFIQKWKETHQHDFKVDKEDVLELLRRLQRVML